MLDGGVEVAAVVAEEAEMVQAELLALARLGQSQHVAAPRRRHYYLVFVSLLDLEPERGAVEGLRPLEIADDELQVVQGHDSYTAFTRFAARG